MTRERTLAAFTANGPVSRMAAPRAVREVVRGCWAEGCAVNLGQAENFRSAEILRARFFAARFFLGSDPDCQRGFGRESEPHPVAVVSRARGASADPTPKLDPGSVVSDMSV